MIWPAIYQGAGRPFILMRAAGCSLAQPCSAGLPTTAISSRNKNVNKCTGVTDSRLIGGRLAGVHRQKVPNDCLSESFILPYSDYEDLKKKSNTNEPLERVGL